MSGFKTQPSWAASVPSPDLVSSCRLRSYVSRQHYQALLSARWSSDRTFIYLYAPVCLPSTVSILSLPSAAPSAYMFH